MKQVMHLIAWIGVLAITSCHSHDNIIEPTPAGFTATIEQNRSRAYDTSWEAGDIIGISGKSAETLYSNIAYTTTGNGTFTAVNAAESILYMNSDTVSFTAYYPWESGATSTIEVSTADQGDQKSFDYLFGTGRGCTASPNVTIAFRHAMAKVVFTLKAGADVTYEELQKAVLQISGIETQGTFNTTTGEAVVNSKNSKSVISVNEKTSRTENSAAATIDYTLILFPQQMGQAVELTFTIGGVTFNATLTLPDENTLASGTQYEVAITLNKTYATVEGCTISGWEKRVLDDIVAE